MIGPTTVLRARRRSVSGRKKHSLATLLVKSSSVIGFRIKRVVDMILPVNGWTICTSVIAKVFQFRVSGSTRKNSALRSPRPVTGLLGHMGVSRKATPFLVTGSPTKRVIRRKGANGTATVNFVIVMPWCQAAHR